ncbi:MAG: hypothetical protein ABFC56_02195, partial [Clostridiaceae bacterium]
MTKKIQYGKQAREAAVVALNEIAEVVAQTVGPAGRPILLSRNVSAVNSTVFHTKDGISVLRELSYLDPIYDAVHRLSMQATADTMINAGDGTTSTLIVAARFASLLHSHASGSPQAAIRAFRKE